MANDMEILKNAYAHEHDDRNKRKAWEYYVIGATQAEIRQMVKDGLVCVAFKGDSFTAYQLTDKGNKLATAGEERQYPKIPATSVLDAMDMVIGWDDIKQRVAFAVEARKRTHFLFEGPPACAKSLVLEALRTVVPDAYMVFGSRTSAAGLSDALFEHQPSMLLADEVDKMHMDTISALLGLMERGEIIDTKRGKEGTRGIVLQTMVFAACNHSDRMPREFLSRFALHVRFPEYTRDQFIDVCTGYMAKSEHCDPELAKMIGTLVFDYGLGDVRKARAVWNLMTEPTEAEARDVIALMVKYGTAAPQPVRKPRVNRQPAFI